MSTYNRLANSNNMYQTNAKRVLCVCSAGLLRSPTVANVLHQIYGYNTRAAGIFAEFALIPVDEVLLQWADEIVFVEQQVCESTKTRFPDLVGTIDTKAVTLALPDRFQWNQAELRGLIEKQYEEKASKPPWEGEPVLQ